MPPRKKKLPPKRKALLKRLIYWLLSGIAIFYIVIALLLLLLRWVNPSFTAVQEERYITAIIHGKAYQKRYEFVPLSRISPNMQHAVIAAEDTRFYQHHGFDWREMGRRWSRI